MPWRRPDDAASLLQLPGPARQHARERGFRMLAGAVSALFMAFAALGGGFLWYDDATGWVTHTNEVRAAVAHVLQDLSEAEAAQRGYILTGDRAMEAEADAATRQARRDLAVLEQLTRDNREQQARVADLRRQMDIRLRVMDWTLAARAAGNPVAAIHKIREGEGSRAMAEIRRVAVQFDEAEARLERQRQDRAATIRVLILLALVGFAASLAALFARAVRDLNLDREAEAETAARLRQLVADRTLLIDEVNHRVKNSLQQIASVVRLQSRGVGPEAREALDKTLDRIMAVGRVHEQLYKAGGEVGQFDAGHYAETLARELVESLGRDDIALETQVDPIQLDVRQAVPLALILNELITNALKYGCPVGKACRLRVVFGTEGETYRLSVSDNGPGLPQGGAPKGRRGPAGLGMRAIEALSRQLEGEFIVEQPQVGAAFAVVFPRRPA